MTSTSEISSFRMALPPAAFYEQEGPMSQSNYAALLKTLCITAYKKFSPHLWVLCLNIDLDSKAHRWFQALQTSYLVKGTRIELVQGSDIVRELIFRKSIRAHYFPGE